MKKLIISVVILIIVLITAVIGFIFISKGKNVRIENVVGEPISESVLPLQGEGNQEVREAEIMEKEKKIEEVKIIENKEESKTEVGGLSIKNNLVNFGFQEASDRKIDTVIIHSSYDALGSDPYSVSGLIAEYKEYGVAPHYLIDRKGNIYRLVEDKNIAYHAGTGKTPDGRSGVNSFSIGIELMNTKKDSYTDKQYASLKNLLASLKKSYKIKYVLGHKDIAPGRKDDPWNFNVDKL